MSERLVSNTGPLIALAIIDRLDLLPQLHDKVLVPDMVHQEVLQGGIENRGVSAYQQASWLQVEKLSTPLERSLLATLDVGEASVVQLARERQISFVLIDERKGRKVARAVHDLRVVGTVGILWK